MQSTFISCQEQRTLEMHTSPEYEAKPALKNYYGISDTFDRM